MVVELILVEEMLGSADGLRAVNERIREDFIVVGSDVISEVTLGRLVQLHRAQTSDITMLLSAVQPEETEKKGIKKINIQEEDQEYIAICDDNRVIMKTPALELDGELSFSKQLLHKCSSFSIRNDLIDVGVYVMSHWIVELVMKNKRISSIRTDLVPFIVKRQFQNISYLENNVAGIQHRRRPLHSLESWIVTSDSQEIHSVMPSIDLANILNERLPSVDTDTINNNLNNNNNNTMSSDHNEDQVSDFLRCYSIVLESSPTTSSENNSNANVTVAPAICQRITTIQAYMNLNR